MAPPDPIWPLVMFVFSCCFCYDAVSFVSSILKDSQGFSRIPKDSLGFSGMLGAILSAHLRPFLKESAGFIGDS